MVSPANAAYIPDLAGEHYLETLGRLHQVLNPKTYLEIGVWSGDSMAKSRCSSIAIDPQFRIGPVNLTAVLSKPTIHFYQMTSDDFFQQYNPTAILGAPVDIAFLDGMHRCEFLLRDFMNTERYCKPNSIIALHDCLPVEADVAHRLRLITPNVAPHRQDWWAGDVWRTSLLLKRHRPDLALTVLDAVPTGLILVSNLNPEDDYLIKNYSRLVREMLSWQLTEIGISSYFQEMNVHSTSILGCDEDVTARFWL